MSTEIKQKALKVLERKLEFVRNADCESENLFAYTSTMMSAPANFEDIEILTEQEAEGWKNRMNTAYWDRFRELSEVKDD